MTDPAFMVRKLISEDLSNALVGCLNLVVSHASLISSSFRQDHLTLQIFLELPAPCPLADRGYCIV